MSGLPIGVDKNANGEEALPASARADWSDLRVFLHVAESGSISAAARTLQMSQPTVSQRLRDLELRLNTQLVARGPQGVVLTEAGAKIRDQVAVMQRSAAAIDRLLRELDDRTEGRVKLTAPDGIGSFWIAPRIPALQRAHPGLTLSLDGGFWPDSPLRDDVDISIQYDARNFGEHVVEPLATVHYAPFAAQSYIDLYGAPKTQAELATHRTVHHAAVQLQKDTWDPKAEAARTLSSYNVETNCSATLVMSVLAGAGIAYLPTCAAAFIQGIVMLGEAPAASPKLYLVYDPAIARVARAERVLSWLKSIFACQANPWFGEVFVHPREFALHPGAGALSYAPPD
ncbi:MAG TPA: LysR family transcriptional regulator [Vitreimonas sp.]|nr:LysR family transcriptional regulator [Vitreimonas sp.]